MDFKLSDINDLLFDYETKQPENCCVAKNLVQEKDGIYICKVCNKTNLDPDITADVHQDNLFNNIQVVGKNARIYAKNIHANSEYAVTRNKNTRNDFLKLNNNCNDKKIPTEVLNYAIELYISIQDAGIVLRNNRRRGTMAKCISYAFKQFSIIRQDKEISKIINISEKSMSIGNKILLDLANKKIINIKIDNVEAMDVVNDFVNNLNINPYYINFIYDIMICEKLDNIKITSKCASIVYMLNFIAQLFKRKTDVYQPLYLNESCNDGSEKANHSSEKANHSSARNVHDCKSFASLIKERFNISKITYNKYFISLVKQRKVIKESFMKYNVPYPVKRKSKIDGRSYLDFLILKNTDTSVTSI